MDKVYNFSINTKKSDEFVNITSFLKKSVADSNIKDGTAVIFCPHTTAGITINENADPDVVRDILVNLDKTFPERGDYHHMEGNSHAHIKASLMGSSATVIIQDSHLLLGIWQGVYFCEFDGPRSRKFHIKIVEG
ncbi:secondary thiamine-phosphate synthase enzyme YjbQ [Clostridium thailandense]|uniref:YjbQ family protein n=1 Tax=Clostridium thailandense TaxID=2794346 RepID=A0A949TKE0_9CLOT|nr:secondary thiamine-phosphate synthase enzyme YjbQ [Clostridium thailandense]MBV7273930.1 YjbQ family protein [Clostridium thailandense]MCH5137212.1 YjbQ family protein [Clostridiaceae bacterium UIB06]